MRLVLCDSNSEIYRVVRRTLRIQLALSLLLLVVSAAALLLITAHFIRPLSKLADAANLLSTGNYDVEFPDETNDELGDLTRAFKTAVGHLKQYSDDMEILAYQDALTRVKNVAAYRIEQSALTEAISKKHAEFAILMLDLNYLKQINDEYGHSAGDLVLIKLASVICRTFPLSAVYRIGGDEFVVILKGMEYEGRIGKTAELKERIRAHNRQAQETWMRISVAYGLSVYNQKTDQSYETVYHRADQAMYQMKQKMHEEDGRIRPEKKKEQD